MAWWLWRTIYLAKLPRLEKKISVALDWTLDLLFSKDLVQFDTQRAPTLAGVGATIYPAPPTIFDPGEPTGAATNRRLQADPAEAHP